MKKKNSSRKHKVHAVRKCSLQVAGRSRFYDSHFEENENDSVVDDLMIRYCPFYRPSGSCKTCRLKPQCRVRAKMGKQQDFIPTYGPAMTTLEKLKLKQNRKLLKHGRTAKSIKFT